MTRRKALWLAVAIAIVGAVVFLIRGTRNTIHEAYASEWVAGHIIQYMEDNSGEWPRSWEDLRPIHNQRVTEYTERKGNGSWKFEMLQRHIIVDWNADPAKLVDLPLRPDSPPFQVVRGRTGAYWSGMEPNALIHKWLIEQVKAPDAE